LRFSAFSAPLRSVCVFITLLFDRFWLPAESARGLDALQDASRGAGSSNFAPACLGLRREAKRHAAFVRTEIFRMNQPHRPLESAVAAPALPAQSMTFRAVREAAETRQRRGLLWPIVWPLYINAEARRTRRSAEL
jgi:hypothetical protein